MCEGIRIALNYLYTCIPHTQNLAGRQGGQKTVNMTGFGPQSDKFELVKVFLVI